MLRLGGNLRKTGACRGHVCCNEDIAAIRAGINHRRIRRRNAESGQIVPRPRRESARNSCEGLAIIGTLVDVVGSKVNAAGRGRIRSDRRNEIQGIAAVGIYTSPNKGKRSRVRPACW